MARSRTSGVMRTTGISRMAVAGLLSISATLAHADRILVFSDDFEAGSVRPQWRGARLDRSAELTGFAGRLGDESVGLAVHPPAQNQEHGGRVTYYLRFDLFTLDGWTGRTEDGSDTRFEVDVGERVIFSHSFSTLLTGGGTYSRPDIGPGPVAFGTAPDCVYRGVIVAFELDASEDLEVAFRAWGLEKSRSFANVGAVLSAQETGKQGPERAAWGIDNVEIWCDYEHNGAGSTGREVEPPFLDDSMSAVAGGGLSPFETGGSPALRPPISMYRPPSAPDLMNGGGGGGGGGGATPVVVPQSTPADPTPETRPDPTDDPDPTEDPGAGEDPPPVPAPGAVSGMVIGLTGVLRRSRR